MNTNTFYASDAITAGWETFKKRPWYFSCVLAGVFFISALLGQLNPWVGNDGMRAFVMMLFVMILQTVVEMGMIAFSLKAVRAPFEVTVHDVIHPQPFFTYLAASFISGLVMAVGFIALILPGIYLVLAFFFVKYVVIEKGLDPIEAMRESARIAHGHKLDLFVFMLVLIAINIIGFLCLFVGLFVSVPVSIFAVAHAYTQLTKIADAHHSK